MSLLVDTIEGRLQLRLGVLTFENEVLRQEIDARDRRIADLEGLIARQKVPLTPSRGAAAQPED